MNFDTLCDLVITFFLINVSDRDANETLLETRPRPRPSQISSKPYVSRPSRDRDFKTETGPTQNNVF